MALADRLQRVLDLRGLTPYDLSKRAGLSQSQVRIWIDRKSERVSTEALRKVAAAAEVSALWLITGSGSPDDDEAREEAGETSAGSAPPATASEEHRAPVELPQRLLERLPPGRPPTAAALAQLVPYRVAAWVATTRARILARAFNAIAL